VPKRKKSSGDTSASTITTRGARRVAVHASVLAVVADPELEAVDQLAGATDLLTSTDVATVFLAADHTIVGFTPAVTRLFELIGADVGRPLEDINTPLDDPELSRDIDSVLQLRAPREKVVPTRDGRWHLRRITPYHAANNYVAGVVATYTEVTAVKRAEQELRQLTEELESRVADGAGELQNERNFVAAVLETEAALVMVCDQDGRVVRCNRACTVVTGYSAEELRGQTIWERLLLPHEKDEVMRDFEQVCAGRSPSRHEHHWRHRDGSRRLISWYYTCMRDARRKLAYVVATGVDVSAERRAGEEARARQAELAHLHRVYTAGEFAAVMAHELNQPLTAIASYSEASLQALRRGQVEPDSLIRDLRQIALQAQRAGQAIRELRKFLSREDQRREPVDLNGVAMAAAELIAPEARARGVRLKLAPSPAPVMVMATPVQLEHVLINLVQNGIEAFGTHDTGRATITIRTDTIGAEAGRGGHARMTVQDNGPGFDASATERLFERFYTTKRNGLGIGLVISRTIVEAHDGRLWAERPVDGGAAFHFTLPLLP